MPKTTFAGESPSYRCARPRITATGTPPNVPRTSVPACPMAVATGQPGMSSYGISTVSSSASANPPRPLPSTTPTAGVPSARARIAATAASSSSFMARRYTRSPCPGVGFSSPVSRLSWRVEPPVAPRWSRARKSRRRPRSSSMHARARSSGRARAYAAADRVDDEDHDRAGRDGAASPERRSQGDARGGSRPGAKA